MLRNMIKIMTLLATAILFFLASSNAHSSSNSISVYYFPKVPLPNSTIDIYCEITTNSKVYIQLCIDDICLIPKEMTKIRESLYYYKYTPGANNMPPTNNGSKIKYSIIIDGTVIESGEIVVRENSPPVFLDHYTIPARPIVGNETKIVVNVSEDIGIEKIFGEIIDPRNQIVNVKIEYFQSAVVTFFTPIRDGLHTLQITAIDVSNQSNTTKIKIFVYPEVSEDKRPPEVIDIYGIEQNSKMKLVVYLTDESGILKARAKIKGKWYELKEGNNWSFWTIAEKSQEVQIYAEDPYGNILNASYKITIFERKSMEDMSILFLVLGLLLGLIVFLPVKSYLLIIPVSVLAIIISVSMSVLSIATNAGGNVYNGKVCWSCLALHPQSSPKGFLVTYPNGTKVSHPAWILENLRECPILIYVTHESCESCKIQWKKMIECGIITEDGSLTPQFKNRLKMIVLDATEGTATHSTAIEIIEKYSVDVKGLPLTVIITKSDNDTIYWYSKSGLLGCEKLKELINEAISMYGDLHEN